ncbi:MAG TPA: pectinesterase family protein [Flavobacteriaceae bacterium]|nr:pectinesterase family protein [Flavobacteriaceae bacterium]
MKLKLFLLFSILGYLVQAQEPYKKLVVAQDGSGDFKQIQEAINSVRDLGPGYVQFYIKNGVYEENIEIPSWKRYLTFIGESKEKTIIVGNNYSGKLTANGGKHSTFTSHTVLVEGDDIHFKNITIQNTWCEKGQAVALHVEGDRFIAEDCNILGCQDTVYTANEGSRQYYLNCYIEGTTDFVFGQATAVFQDCEIHSLKDSYITAAATPQNQDFGYVFFNAKLTSKEDVREVYLGRPWRPFAKTVFINSEMGKHILPEGWYHWPGDAMFPEKENTAYYAEYNSKGEGANAESRIGWSHQLSEEQVKTYTLENIFKGWIPSEIKLY